MSSIRMVARTPRRTFQLVALAAVVVALPLVWYLGSPLLLNQAVDESLPPAASAGETSGTVHVLAQGRFGVVDAIHKGEGTAAILRLADGRRVLRLDDFRVTNGPDLYVYLSGDPAPRSSGALHTAGAFEVARLKGNAGSQNYDLPAGLDLSRFRSAVIYCRRFTTVFSTAELVPGA
jgi:Electron transfer DM13